VITLPSLLTLENVTAAPIEAGDAGIILKADGSFRVFNCHEGLNPDNVTEAQKDQARKMMAFAVALQVPAVMEILYDFARNPDIVGSLFDRGQFN
jgi:hypothetical protein